jgi:hypothetical protein
VKTAPVSVGPISIEVHVDQSAIEPLQMELQFQRKCHRRFVDVADVDEVNSDAEIGVAVHGRRV